jgi:hypothetical protein
MDLAVFELGVVVDTATAHARRVPARRRHIDRLSCVADFRKGSAVVGSREVTVLTPVHSIQADPTALAANDSANPMRPVAMTRRPREVRLLVRSRRPKTFAAWR